MKTGIWALREHITLDAGMHLSLSGLGKVSYTYPLITLESLLDQLQQKLYQSSNEAACPNSNPRDGLKCGRIGVTFIFQLGLFCNLL
jgi:hypothetical protein